MHDCRRIRSLHKRKASTQPVIVKTLVKATPAFNDISSKMTRPNTNLNTIATFGLRLPTVNPTVIIPTRLIIAAVIHGCGPQVFTIRKMPDKIVNTMANIPIRAIRPPMLPTAHSAAQAMNIPVAVRI